MRYRNEQQKGDEVVTRMFAMNIGWRLLDVLVAKGILAHEEAAAIVEKEAVELRTEVGDDPLLKPSAERIAVWLEKCALYYRRRPAEPTNSRKLVVISSRDGD